MIIVRCVMRVMFVMRVSFGFDVWCVMRVCCV